MERHHRRRHSPAWLLQAAARHRRRTLVPKPEFGNEGGGARLRPAHGVGHASIPLPGHHHRPGRRHVA